VRFALRMAARELRASWKRLLFFFIAMAIGVAAIVALRSVIQSVRDAITQESKSLTAADVVLRTDRPWDEDQRAVISERLAEAPVRAQMESLETTTMVRPEDETIAMATMVELRAVEPEFPFYGEIVLRSGRPYSHQLLSGAGVIVRPELLARLGLEVGDRIIIGNRTFTIRDEIVKEPGRQFSMFNLGPRVLMDYADVEKTGIIQYGSRARFKILLQVDEAGVEPLVEKLRQDFKGEYVRVRSYKETGDRIGRRLARSENYLSLVGFIILILGGIGVWSVVRVFVQQKLKSIAVLKCLGASTRQILGTYLVQVLGLGAAGSLLGVVLATVILETIPPESFGLDVQGVPYGLTFSAVTQGIGVGLLVSLLFSFVPLLEIRRIRPLVLLRPGSVQTQRFAPRGGLRRRAQDLMAGVDRVQLTAGALVIAALVAVASWQAGSLQVGVLVSVGFAGVAAALHLTGRGLVRAVVPLARRKWFPLRHAVINVSRPGNQTRVILLAVGLGAFFIITIHAIESTLLEQFALELREDAPDMFLLDIQPDQEPSLRELAVELGAGHVQLVPVLQARVSGVEGRRLKLDGYEEVRKRGWLAREFVVTFRDRLEDNETIEEGRFWDPTPSSEPEVSIENSFKENFGIEVGDTMRFDILGRTVSARVTSIREVEWSDSRNGGFMIVFRPGALDRAPHTYLGFMKGPDDFDERGRFQRDLIADYPNVTIVDLRDILNTLQDVIGKVSLAISVVGVIALMSGGLILVGSVAMTRFQRRYETAIFRTLGASKRNVAIMMLLEYGTLGALAGTIGALGAQVLTWALSSRVLEIDWTPVLSPGFIGIVLAALGVSIVGVVVTLDVLRQKPMSILRAE
jgi:putative ABC transport system permease protein